MYKIGDLILYGNTGVCRVTNIKSCDLQGTGGSKLYYFLKPLYQNCMISTPVNTDKVFMRPIISKSEAEQLIDSIPSIRPEIFHSRILREVTVYYESLLKTYDCADLMELSVSINAKKKITEEQNRKFSLVDERFLKRTEELLFGELAAALGIPKDDVPNYIAARVGGKGGETVYGRNS